MSGPTPRVRWLAWAIVLCVEVEMPCGEMVFSTKQPDDAIDVRLTLHELHVSDDHLGVQVSVCRSEYPLSDLADVFRSVVTRLKVAACFAQFM